MLPIPSASARYLSRLRVGGRGGAGRHHLQALQQLHDDGKSPGQSTFSAFSRPNLRSLCYTPDELIVNLPRQATKWPLSIPSSLILDQASEEHRLTAVARIRLGRCELRRWKMRTDDRSQLWPLQRNVQIVFQAAVFKRTRAFMRTIPSQPKAKNSICVCLRYRR